MSPENRVGIEENVLVDTIDGRELRYDVYTPPGAAKNAPGVLLIHGGGWASGEPAQLRGYGIFLGRLGYVCVSAAYRLSGEAKWPAQIHDTKAALRWMKANAQDLGVDPDRIAVHGNSAGAHLALMMAATANMPEFEGSGIHPGIDTSVRACIAIYPPVHIGPMPLQGMFLQLMGPQATADDCRQATPSAFARKDFAPTMLIHGTGDELVPWKESRRMYDALVEAGAAAELHLLEGLPHAFDANSAYSKGISTFIDMFLRRHMAPRETAAATR